MPPSFSGGGWEGFIVMLFMYLILMCFIGYIYSDVVNCLGYPGGGGEREMLCDGFSCLY